jgi:hypothetical protein
MGAFSQPVRASIKTLDPNRSLARIQSNHRMAEILLAIVPPWYSNHVKIIIPWTHLQRVGSQHLPRQSNRFTIATPLVPVYLVLFVAISGQGLSSENLCHVWGRTPKIERNACKKCALGARVRYFEVLQCWQLKIEGTMMFSYICHGCWRT